MIIKVFSYEDWDRFIHIKQRYIKYKGMNSLIRDLLSFKDVSTKIFISQINYGPFKIIRTITTICAGPRVYL